jgi:uncharacterized protein (TIGR02271 family)
MTSNRKIRDNATGQGLEHDSEPFDHMQDTQETHVNASDELLVPVVEETLGANKHQVERGAVHVNKHVVQEQQTLDVPVTEEEVEITRRRVDRPVTDADTAFEEGTLEVPLRGEEISLEKSTRVVEEIDVDKTTRQHTERVSDTVRREEVNIDTEGGVIDNRGAHGGSSGSR